MNLFSGNDNISTLKDHIKKARTWLNKLEKLEKRNDTNVTSLEQILPEADNFVIDISSSIESIVQITEVYCLCRQPYHGFMIGCETCPDWLHISCIGLSKAQVDHPLC